MILSARDQVKALSETVILCPKLDTNDRPQYLGTGYLRPPEKKYGKDKNKNIQQPVFACGHPPYYKLADVWLKYG